jgi:hypothetical protein
MKESTMNLQDKSHMPSLPPSPSPSPSPPSLAPGQEANTDNIDILPKLHHVSYHSLDFIKAHGINGLMSEEGFASFHPSSMNTIHSKQKA